jgi:hypothetical protein
MTIEKLTRHKSLVIDQISAELTKAGGRTIHSEIHKLILFEIRRNCLSCGKELTLHLFIRRVIKQTVVITGAYHFCQLHTKFYPTFCCHGYCHMQRKPPGNPTFHLYLRVMWIHTLGHMGGSNRCGGETL